MTSADFRVSYASVTDTLFDYIEQDLALLATALLDDDDDSDLPERAFPNHPERRSREGGNPSSMRCHRGLR